MGCGVIAGVVHRDLKSENIMVSPEGSVTVVDFDNSISMGNADMLSASVAGSLLGKAPEVFGSGGTGCLVTPAADMWSIGVLLYWAFCGQPPFQKEQDSDVVLCSQTTGKPSQMAHRAHG